MHKCPQVFALLCESGCFPMNGLVYHTYASALWGVANQAAPMCTHAHGHAHAHARVHVCVSVPYVPPPHLIHTRPYAPLPCRYAEPLSRLCQHTVNAGREGATSDPVTAPSIPSNVSPATLSRPKARIGHCPRCSSPWSRGRSAYISLAQGSAQ